MIMNEELAIRLTNLYIERLGISDEDLIQDAYCIALEMVGNNYINPYSVIKGAIQRLASKRISNDCYYLQEAESCGYFSTENFNKIETEIEVEKYLQILSQRERKVIELICWEGMSLRGAAQSVGITTERVRFIMLKAIAKMRRAASKYN